MQTDTLVQTHGKPAERPRRNPRGVYEKVHNSGEWWIRYVDASGRYLPDNIYTALENFRKSKWATTLFGEDVKERYAELKQASADRCPRLLGTFVKAPEVQYHHEVYNQFLWNLF